VQLVFLLHCHRRGCFFFLISRPSPLCSVELPVTFLASRKLSFVAIVRCSTPRSHNSNSPKIHKRTVGSGHSRVKRDTPCPPKNKATTTVIRSPSKIFSYCTKVTKQTPFAHLKTSLSRGRLSRGDTSRNCTTNLHLLAFAAPTTHQMLNSPLLVHNHYNHHNHHLKSEPKYRNGLNMPSTSRSPLSDWPAHVCVYHRVLLAFILLRNSED
jgi:hypothetical protein